ncbi:MAG: hypothetical protein JNL11_10565 [Bdellovibrionaceae bacterium]|nr:hypothetical protein [Pseudobdellovibrionaceae bacterium]
MNIRLFFILFIITNLSHGSTCIGFYAPKRTQHEVLNFDIPAAFSKQRSISPPHLDVTIDNLKRILGLSDSAFVEAQNEMFNADGFTGKFDRMMFSYAPNLKLSLENGRQKLRAIRINLSDSEMSIAVLQDMYVALRLIPGLEIIVIVAPGMEEKMNLSMQKVPAEIRSRIKIILYDSKDPWLTGLTPAEAAVELGNIWAQDHSKPFENGKKLSTFIFRKFNDSLATEQLKKSDKIDTKNYILDLDGGNIIVGDRNILIGANSVYYIMREGLSYESVIQFLEASFSKKVLVVGVPKLVGEEIRMSQSSFHIDLDLVLAVDKTTNSEIALVRSPIALITEILNIPYERKIPDVDYVKFLEQKLLAFYKEKAKHKPLTASTIKLLEVLTQMDPKQMVADELASLHTRRWLEIHGYTTREVPGYGFFSTTMAKQNFFFGTNSILSGNIALVPWNNIPELDQAIGRIYKNLGYEYYPMRSSVQTIECHGGIRCASETYRFPLKE